MQAETPTSLEFSALLARQQARYDTAALLRVVLEQFPDMPQLIEGAYFHIPFCFHKCHYCDFYSLVDTRDRQEAFTQRMLVELQSLGQIFQPRPRTIFVGGGTPTLLKPELWVKLLAELHRGFDLSRLEELTVEANPETVTPQLMSVLAEGGVNRVSIGSQSFNTDHLKTLERWHDPQTVGRAVDMARHAGIRNVNLDLIFAIPGQTLQQWLEDLRKALALEPQHLSCYSLTYEPNTPMTQKLKMGLVKRTDNALEEEMYAATIEHLTQAGYEHYEVSNFAKPGHRCRHNLLYWRNSSWLAIGPSAAGHLNGVRWKNMPHLGRYLASTGGCPVQDVEQLDAVASVGEQLMLGFRLLEGVENAWLDSVTTDRHRQILAGYVSDGLMLRTPTHTRLSPKGLMWADSLLAELL